MAESLRITLKYRGKGVDDGTMPIDEVAEALTGFSGAYGKVATRVDHSVTHQLRVGAIDDKSFDILIYAAAAITAATPYAQQVQAAEKVVSAAKYVFTLVTGIVRAKKHTKRRPYDFSIKGDNNTVFILNAEGAELEVPREVVELLRDRTIDSDLKKIISPLETHRVDEVELMADTEKEHLSESVTSAEREYFELEPAEITTKEMEVIGELVSLNKERNRGTVRLKNQTVPYRYVGDDREQFHSDFSHEGPVRIRAVAELSGDDFSLVRLDIKSVQPIQGTLGLFEPSSGEKKS